MKQCNGPCEQGRKPCPTPWACEVEEPEHDMLRVVLFDVIVALMVLACVAMIVWGVVG